MKLGDEIKILDCSWAVRPFTPQEHQRYETLAEGYGLRELAARLQAFKGARSSTMREKLLRSQITNTETKLDQYLDGDGLKADLSEEDQSQAFYHAALLDMYQEQLDNVKSERVSAILVIEDQLLESQEKVNGEFMFELLKPDMKLDEFLITLTDEGIALIDQVVSLGKLPGGLSAWTRRQVTAWAQILELYQQQQNGKDSELQQLQQDAPPKPGRTGRSKKSSSKSKVGS